MLWILNLCTSFEHHQLASWPWVPTSNSTNHDPPWRRELPGSENFCGGENSEAGFQDPLGRWEVSDLKSRPRSDRKSWDLGHPRFSFWCASLASCKLINSVRRTRCSTCCKSMQTPKTPPKQHTKNPSYTARWHTNRWPAKVPPMRRHPEAPCEADLGLQDLHERRTQRNALRAAVRAVPGAAASGMLSFSRISVSKERFQCVI